MSGLVEQYEAFAEIDRLKSDLEVAEIMIGALQMQLIQKENEIQRLRRTK